MCSQWGGCWLSMLTGVTLLCLGWMYICLVTFNDREDINWQGFNVLKWWLNWFMVLVIISAALTSYCLLLLLFALLQVALGEQLDLHWLHKIFLFLGVVLVALGVTGISVNWQQEWPTVPLSLQATAPFLQFGGVGALTLLTSLVFHSFLKAKQGSKFLIAAVFLSVSAAIFLCPLFIQSPCLIDPLDLPEKPKLIGHRGAPMLAPENTMMSFNRSIACNMAGLETDVQLSKDRIPFLMHDHGRGFLLRTTNVKETFPNQTFNGSSDLTFQELQGLNAGSWFLKLSEEEKERARHQSIPSLLQLLDLAKKHKTVVIFDLYSNDQENDTVDVVQTILRSGIDQSLVLWLPPDGREYVNDSAPGFIHIYNNVHDMLNRGGKHLNVKYNKLRMKTIRDLREKNVTVNMWVVNERWLFSLLWCAGVSSVTTNSCYLQHVRQPDWIMAPSHYKVIWIAVDIVSAVIMIGVFTLKRKTSCVCHRGETQRNPPAAWNETELYPFLQSSCSYRSGAAVRATQVREEKKSSFGSESFLSGKMLQDEAGPSATPPRTPQQLANNSHNANANAPPNATFSVQPPEPEDVLPTEMMVNFYSSIISPSGPEPPDIKTAS